MLVIKVGHNCDFYLGLQVLKSYGLVDVQQEEPYGDIALKLTPQLLKDLD